MNHDFDLDLDLNEDELSYAEEDEISYQELYGRVLEESPVIITVSRGSVSDIKRGITNAKHAARKKALYHGLPWDPAILRFETQETENEEERQFYIDLKISAERKGTVKIKRYVKKEINLETD